MGFLTHTSFRWALALGVWIAVVLVLTITKRVVIHYLAPLATRTSTDLDDKILALVRGIKPFLFWAVGLAVATSAIGVPSIGRIVKDIVWIAVALQLLFSGSQAIGIVSERWLDRTAGDEADKTARNALEILFRVGFWVIVILVTLENLGIKVSTLVAGLGVGGIAAALALQSVASDLFASLAIMWDKPFHLGDFIVIDTFSGTVEKVGIKTTRIRSISGEELIISNSDLVKGRIHNFKRMTERRVVFAFGVTYQTPLQALAEIPSVVEHIIENLPRTRFDRVHFKTLGPSSLDFEVVYYVLSSDYKEYMDVQQAINLALVREFASRHIDFAYPTQTVYLARQE